MNDLLKTVITAKLAANMVNAQNQPQAKSQYVDTGYGFWMAILDLFLFWVVHPAAAIGTGIAMRSMFPWMMEPPYVHLYLTIVTFIYGMVWFAFLAYRDMEHGDNCVLLSGIQKVFTIISIVVYVSAFGMNLFEYITWLVG
ncbi:MAG: hypothetical protein ACYDG4_16760 [Desulfuromonadaceae bacterium]